MSIIYCHNNTVRTQAHVLDLKELHTMKRFLGLTLKALNIWKEHAYMLNLKSVQMQFGTI